MSHRKSTTQHRLLIAGGLAAFAVLLTTIPSVSRATDETCPAALAPNGKVFGSRFGPLLGRAGIAAITGHKAAASALADAAVRDVGDTARENATAEAAAAACRKAAKDKSLNPADEAERPVGGNDAQQFA